MIDQTLAQYHAAGVRGVRLSAKEVGSDEEIVRSVKKFAAVARKHDWVLQLRTPATQSIRTVSLVSPR